MRIYRRASDKMQLRYIKSVKEAEEKMAKVAAVAWPVAHRLFIAAARGRLPALPHQPAQLPLPRPPRCRPRRAASAPRCHAGAPRVALVPGCGAPARPHLRGWPSQRGPATAAGRPANPPRRR